MLYYNNIYHTLELFSSKERLAAFLVAEFFGEIPTNHLPPTFTATMGLVKHGFHV